MRLELVNRFLRSNGAIIFDRKKMKYWKKIYTDTTLYIRKFTLTIPCSNPVFYGDN
jgi:hypothetical protein